MLKTNSFSGTQKFWFPPWKTNLFGLVWKIVIVSMTKSDVKYVKPHANLKCVKLYRNVMRKFKFKSGAKRRAYFSYYVTSLYR